MFYPLDCPKTKPVLGRQIGRRFIFPRRFIPDVQVERRALGHTTSLEVPAKHDRWLMPFSLATRIRAGAERGPGYLLCLRSYNCESWLYELAPASQKRAALRRRWA
ncbi:hypothetical protein MRX96_052574 [Rhipicephalus microplus]